MEKITSKVFRRKSGARKGQWVARIVYFNAAGEKKTLDRTAETRRDAKDLRDAWLDEIKKTGGNIQAGARMTFNDLAVKAGGQIYRPAKIVEGRKVAGVRSYATAQNNLAVLKKYFGKRKISNITADSLEGYRDWRLELGSRRPELVKRGENKSIKLSTVNGELSTMRALMKYAFAKGWIPRDIFLGSKVIVRAFEDPRTRRISTGDEKKLLAACSGEREHEGFRIRNGKKETVRAVFRWEHAHLRAAIVIAIDTGMRRGEILKLRWKDINIPAGSIRVIATHTKTEEARDVPLTDRVIGELQQLYRRLQHEPKSDESVFPIADFKRAWASVKKTAGITDLHFHDLRSTAITRWIELGMTPAQAGKLAGHKNPATTLKFYTIADQATVQSLTEKLNAFNNSAVPMAAEQISDFVN